MQGGDAVGVCGHQGAEGGRGSPPARRCRRRGWRSCASAGRAPGARRRGRAPRGSRGRVRGCRRGTPPTGRRPTSPIGRDRGRRRRTGSAPDRASSCPRSRLPRPRRAPGTVLPRRRRPGRAAAGRHAASGWGHGGSSGPCARGTRRSFRAPSRGQSWTRLLTMRRRTIRWAAAKRGRGRRRVADLPAEGHVVRRVVPDRRPVRGLVARGDGGEGGRSRPRSARSRRAPAGGSRRPRRRRTPRRSGPDRATRAG